MSYLVFYRSGEEMLRVQLEERQLRLGRGADNDVALPDPAVSRTHCRIDREGPQWFLTDLSGHGTLVNGKAVERAELVLGTRIALGPWTAVLQAESEAGGGVTQREERKGHTQPFQLSDLADANQAPELRLRVKTSRGERTFPLGKSGFTLGTDEKSDLVVSSPFASRNHARIDWRDGSYWLVDVGSTNGTFLNGSLVREAQLREGANIKMGDVELWVERARSGKEEAGPAKIHGMVGRGPAMGRVFEFITMAANSDAPVIIHGETGTGKELVARALHEGSRRRLKPFEAINCSAVNADLVESELFGHVKGAYTGATSDRAGAFELADGGTLFLDEVGEMSLEMQAKLLRVLETGEVRRVGGEKTRLVEVRVVAATHRDLPQMVKEGAFREDLFYRLNVLVVHLTPLRQRKADIILLAEYFLSVHRPPDKPASFSEAAKKKLQGYSFPGNVRELQNLMRKVCAMVAAPVIDVEHLQFDSAEGWKRVEESEVESPDGRDQPKYSVTLQKGEDDQYLFLGDGRNYDQLCYEIIARAVRFHGSKSEAAKVLKTARSTVTKACMYGPNWRKRGKQGKEDGEDPEGEGDE